MWIVFNQLGDADMAGYFRKPTGEVFGPHTADELREFAKSGELTSECEVQRGGTAGEWIAATKLRGLAFADVDQIAETASDVAPPPLKEFQSVDSVRKTPPSSTVKPTEKPSTGDRVKIAAEIVTKGDPLIAVAKPAPQLPQSFSSQGRKLTRRQTAIGMGATGSLLLLFGILFCLGKLGSPAKVRSDGARDVIDDVPIRTVEKDSANAAKKTQVANSKDDASTLDAVNRHDALLQTIEKDSANVAKTTQAANRKDDAPALDTEIRRTVRDDSSLYASAEPAVIRIDVRTSRGNAIGSGFIVSSDGIAVTNFHVIEGAESAKATFHDGSTAEVAGTFYVDEDRDIAILKISAPRKLHFVPLSSETARKGERVIAIGTPNGLSFSVTEGIVSAVRLGSELSEFGLNVPGTWIQTSTPISPGNSGGPLINASGSVIGANTITLRNAQNVNFAISSHDIISALEKAKKEDVRSFSKHPIVRSSKSQAALSNTPGGDAETTDRTAEHDEFVKRVNQDRDKRVKQMAELESKIASKKMVVKEAILAGDLASELKHRSAIRAMRREIASVAKTPPTVDRLNLLDLRTGQIGILGGSMVQILQVTNKEQGECLAISVSPSGRLGKTVRLRGMDLTSKVDDDIVVFSTDMVLGVVGTDTYPTVSGGTNTVFVVEAIANLSDVFTPIPFNEAKSQDEPDLSEAEQKQVAQMKAEAQQVARQKTAQGKLRLAKQLMDSGKSDGARRSLLEILRDYADTDSVKEAQKQLDNLKK